MKPKILTILRLAGERGMPEVALRMEIEMRYGITVGEMAFGIALEELTAGGFAKSKIWELTGDRHWELTDKGRIHH